MKITAGSAPGQRRFTAASAAKLMAAITGRMQSHRPLHQSLPVLRKSGIWLRIAVPCTNIPPRRSGRRCQCRRCAFSIRRNHTGCQARIVFMVPANAGLSAVISERRRRANPRSTTVRGWQRWFGTSTMRAGARRREHIYRVTITTSRSRLIRRKR